MTAVDFCAGCGTQLRGAPLGGRYRCCSDVYWSTAEPNAHDQARYERMNGFQMLRQLSAHRRPPLWLYGGFFK